MLKVSIKYGYEKEYPAAWLENGTDEEKRAQRFRVRFNAQLFAISSEELLKEAGVTVYYGTSVCAATKENDKISALILENKSGRSAMKIKKDIMQQRQIDTANYTIDVIDEGKEFYDSIGMICNWRKRGPIYQIPYRCLYGKRVKNLITAGRCISASDSMWDITRVIPACAVTGQAAGTAATMTDNFMELDIEHLQKDLIQNGVQIH